MASPDGSPSPTRPQPREDLETNIERQRESGSLDKGMAHLSALLKKERSELVIRPKNRSPSQQRYRDKAAKIWAEAASKEVFPFFALPTELRLAVYFELLVTDERLLVMWHGPRRQKLQSKPMYTGILRASKQCRDEGLTVLYGENIFDMEEICRKPMKIAKPFLSRIGPLNAGLIRIVIAKYSAAAEELHQLGPANPFHNIPAWQQIAVGSNSFFSNARSPYPYISVDNLKDFLKAFGINLFRLRLMAIGIAPYGADDAVQCLMRMQAPLVMNSPKDRVLWLDAKNERERMGKLVDGICEREHCLIKAEYWDDVDAKVGFRWNNPDSTRPWVMIRAPPVVSSVEEEDNNADSNAKVNNNDDRSKSNRDGSGDGNGKRKTVGKAPDISQKRVKA